MAPRSEGPESAQQRLARYRAMRDFAATPEPSGDVGATGEGRRFVVQQHDATRLHWDLRIEHEGVLASWALPRGIPWTPDTNRLAVHTEDHPLEYLDFEGNIPDGSYGAGEMFVWDRGTYELEKWEDRKVTVVLHGAKARGRHALFATRGRDWMIHRMDPPADPTRRPVPTDLRPMEAMPWTLDAARDLQDDEAWATEVAWRGERVLVVCEPGDVRIFATDGREITGALPEVRRMGRATGSLEAVLDGVLVPVGADGRPLDSAETLAHRLVEASASTWRRLAQKYPAAFLAFDLIWLEGHPLVDEPWHVRRELLEQIHLDGPAWQTPTAHRGDARDVFDAAASNGLGGLVLKRIDGTYRPGEVSEVWRSVSLAGST
jgi:bifunctional non-homologous end joining protein LigD